MKRMDKLKQNRPESLYFTDEAAHDKRHTVLSLSVAHCELNPIELAWKEHVAKRND